MTVWSVRYHTAHMGAVLGVLEQRVPGLKFISVPPEALLALAASSSAAAAAAPLRELALGFAHGTASAPALTAANGSSKGNDNGKGTGNGHGREQGSSPPSVVGIDMAALLGSGAHAQLPYRSLDSRLRYWREHSHQTAAEANGNGKAAGEGQEQPPKPEEGALVIWMECVMRWVEK